MKTLRIGVVGCGHNSENHLRVYAHTGGVRIAAVCDEVLPKAKEKARRYHADHALSSYDSMLKLDLDLVDIVTPTPTHAPLSRLALEAGHNVLVEKPMALSSEECLEMMKTAKKCGRTLCVVHNKLFFNSVARAKAAAEDGSLRITRMRTTHFFAYSQFIEKWRLSEESGGILWDAMVHPVYITEHLLGPTASVYAVARRVKEQTFDSFAAVLEGEKVGLVEYAWDAKQPLFEFQLLAEDGQSFHADLVYDVVTRSAGGYSNLGMYLLGVAARDLHNPLARGSRYLQNFLEIRSYPGALPFARTFFILIRRLLSFLRTDQGTPPVMPEQGLHAVKVLEAIRKSIKSGQPQTV